MFAPHSDYLSAYASSHSTWQEVTRWDRSWTYWITIFLWVSSKHFLDTWCCLYLLRRCWAPIILPWTKDLPMIYLWCTFMIIIMFNLYIYIYTYNRIYTRKKVYNLQNHTLAISERYHVKALNPNNVAPYSMLSQVFLTSGGFLFLVKQIFVGPAFVF